MRDVTLPTLGEFAAVNRVILQSEAWAIHGAVAARAAGRLRPAGAPPPDAGRVHDRRRLCAGAAPAAGDDRRGRGGARARSTCCCAPARWTRPAASTTPAETERTYPRQARTPFNVTGHPALAMMAGLSSGGLPLSVQFVGRYFDEATLFRVAARLGAGGRHGTRSSRRSGDLVQRALSSRAQRGIFAIAVRIPRWLGMTEVHHERLPRRLSSERRLCALAVDKAFYKRIAEETAGRRLVESFTIPIRTGRAWTVPAGHVFRIVTVEGPQVGDLNIWNRAQSARAAVGVAHPPAPGGARHDVRPAVVDPALPAAAGDHHLRQPGRLRRRRVRRAHPRPARHALRSLRQPHADRRGFRLPLPFEPGARRGAATA